MAWTMCHWQTMVAIRLPLIFVDLSALVWKAFMKHKIIACSQTSERNLQGGYNFWVTSTIELTFECKNWGKSNDQGINTYDICGHFHQSIFFFFSLVILICQKRYSCLLLMISCYHVIKTHTSLCRHIIANSSKTYT